MIGAQELGVDPMGRSLDRGDALLVVGPRVVATEYKRRACSREMGGHCSNISSRHGDANHDPKYPKMPFIRVNK